MRCLLVVLLLLCSKVSAIFSPSKTFHRSVISRVFLPVALLGMPVLAEDSTKMLNLPVDKITSIVKEGERKTLMNIADNHNKHKIKFRYSVSSSPSNC